MSRGVGGARWLARLAGRSLWLFEELLGSAIEYDVEHMFRFLELVSGFQSVSIDSRFDLYWAVASVLEEKSLLRSLAMSWPALRVFDGGDALSDVVWVCLAGDRLWVANKDGLVMLYRVEDFPMLLGVYGVPGASIEWLSCYDGGFAAVASCSTGRRLFYVADGESGVVEVKREPVLVSDQSGLYVVVESRHGMPELLPVNSLLNTSGGQLCASPHCRSLKTPSGHSLLYNDGVLYGIENGRLHKLVEIGETPDYADVSPSARIALLIGTNIYVYDSNGRLLWREKLKLSLTPRGIAWNEDDELLGVVMDEAVYVYSSSGEKLYSAWHEHVLPGNPPGLAAWYDDMFVHATGKGVGFAIKDTESLARLPLGLTTSPIHILANERILVVSNNKTILIADRDGTLNILDASKPIHILARLEPGKNSIHLKLYPVTCPQFPSVDQNIEAEKPCTRLQSGKNPRTLQDMLELVEKREPFRALATLTVHTNLTIATRSYLEQVEVNTILEN